MYYCGRPIYTIPEYISRKYKSSANILYNDYAEDLSSGYIYTTYARIHTIEMKSSSIILYKDYKEDFILDVYPNAFLLRFAD